MANVAAYEIAEAWESVGRAVEDYQRAHNPYFREREAERVVRVFGELALLLKRAQPESET